MERGEEIDPVSDFLGMVARFRRFRFPDEPRPSISFQDFRQVVRRYRPSDLLPALAKLSASTSDPRLRNTDLLQIPPWMVATAARESLLWGNEFRRADVTGDALRLIANAHSNIYEGDVEPSAAGVLDLMTRLAYEQFLYQESIFEEVSRSHALMIEGATRIETEAISDDAWVRVFGAPFGQIVGATFFLQVAASQNEGWFYPEWTQLADLDEIYRLWPPEVILQRVNQLSSTIEEFRENYAAVKHPPRGYERYAYNPLVKRPFIRMTDGRFLAPQPRLILRTVSPAVVYHEGVSVLGDGFARDLGRLTESYVGELLRSVRPEVPVFPEITYRRKNQEFKSTDWFVVLPSVVLLLEVKSARYGLLERAAFAGYRDRIAGLLNKAMGQLERSSQEMDQGSLGFHHLPTDRPRVGLVITGEPFYLANSPWFRETLRESPFPVLVASLREIELLTSLDSDEIGRQLLSIAFDEERSTWSLGNALEARPDSGRNVVLDRAWNSYPWPAVRRRGGNSAGPAVE